MRAVALSVLYAVVTAFLLFALLRIHGVRGGTTEAGPPPPAVALPPG